MPAVSNNVVSAVAPFVLRRAKWAYLGYGLVAYAGLRAAKHFGLFGDYPARAVDFIDNKVKSQFGMTTEKKTEPASAY